MRKQEARCTASKTMGTQISMTPRNWICPKDASLDEDPDLRRPQPRWKLAYQPCKMLSRDPGHAMTCRTGANTWGRGGYFKPPHVWLTCNGGNRKLTHRCSSRHWESMVKRTFQASSWRWQSTVSSLEKPRQGKGEKVKKQPRVQSK